MAAEKKPDGEPDDLHFLQPSSRPDALDEFLAVKFHERTFKAGNPGLRSDFIHVLLISFGNCQLQIQSS